ncbi:MAG: DUF6516 family protein [Bacteroidales bacterium]|nr:DUF6516 family protein [Bacteroidales bacterium]
MIFRYDNMPHHPKIESFPHYKHINEDIHGSTEPDLLYVLNEIKEYRPE